MDKEVVGTTSIGLFFGWLCNHVGDIESFVIFFLTAVYLCYKIKYVYRKNKQIEQEVKDDEELL